jgi:predicted RND superfamily exporter protein
VLTLAVADSIHLLTTMLALVRRGFGRKRAAMEALRVNLQPVFLTSLTTAVGFLTMNFSDAPPFRDLGNLVAIGVTAAFVYSVCFLPALMTLLPLRVKPRPEKSDGSTCDGLARFVIRHRKALFRGITAGCLLIMMGMLRIELNDNFVEYFDHSFAFRRDADYIQKNLTGLNIIEYTLESGESNGINDPTFLRTVEAFVSWYRTQPKVAHVNALTDTYKRLNKAMHADDPIYYRIPQNRELAAQNLLLYEMSLPFGLDLNDQINVNKSSLRITVAVADISSRELRDMDERARAWLKENAPPQMFTYGTGLSIMFAHISQRNIRSMLGASFGALLVIAFLLVLAFRSVKFGVISLVPNLAPAFMAFGIWGIAVRQVGLVVSVIVALTLGIVVDDTVHYISKYLRARREHGMTPVEAVRYAFNAVGTALWVTTASLVAGFCVLAFSGFKINSDMGMMVALTISLALAMDFFYLPTLLIKVEGKAHETSLDTGVAVLDADCVANSGSRRTDT